MFVKFKTMVGVEVVLNANCIAAIYREPSAGRVVATFGGEYSISADQCDSICNVLEVKSA